MAPQRPVITVRTVLGTIASWRESVAEARTTADPDSVRRQLAHLDCSMAQVQSIITQLTEPEDPIL